MRSITARLASALLAAVLLGALLAASASAALTSVGVAATPTTTAAGDHPDLAITTSFAYDSPTDSAQDVTLHLGPGLIGSPAAAPTCDQATFTADGACPAGSQIGTTNLGLIAFTPAPTPLTFPGVVYNLDVPAGDGTHLAFLGLRVTTLAGDLNEISPVTTSPRDLGFDATLDGLPNMVGPAPIQVTSIGLTLWGALRNGGETGFFMTNPTQCRDRATVTVTSSSHGAASTTQTGSDGYLATDCAGVPFSGGGVQAQVSPPQTDVPAQVGVTVTQPAAPVQTDSVTRQNAQVMQSTTVLPPGVTINPSLGVGLAACSDAQFGAGDFGSAASCPAASRIGSVSFVAPIVGRTFDGPVYFGTPTAAAANRLLVDVPIPGAHLKLAGSVRLNPIDGQITTVFANLPQIPFTRFDLTFRGGPHSVLSTGTSCGAQTVSSTLVPNTRLTSATPPDATASTTFSTSFDGHGAPCQSLFRPWFNGVLSNPTAGGTGFYALTFARPDRDAQISQMTLRLPAGLVGDLALSGLTQCSLSAARAAACPSSSRVGGAAVQVGPGPASATLPGTVFLTAPQVAGDPAGLSIVIPATLGPVALGNVIVAARLQLRSNGGLTVSATLPQFQAGVPLAIRSVALELDRSGFMRTPTSCDRRRYSADFTPLGGGSQVTTFAAFTIANCKALRFSPRIRATLGARGRTRAGTHPPFTTTITQPGAGQAAIRRAHVLLPAALSTNTRALNAACTQAALDAGRCSSRARIATATAVSPLVRGTLRGPVFLVRRSRGLPKLVVQLRGPLAISFEGFVRVGKRNRIANTFPAIPDLTVTRFALSFHSGRFGVLTANRSLCARRLRLPSQFTGQNGKRLKQQPRIAVQGCAKPKKRG